MRQLVKYIPEIIEAKGNTQIIHPQNTTDIQFLGKVSRHTETDDPYDQEQDQTIIGLLEGESDDIDKYILDNTNLNLTKLDDEAAITENERLGSEQDILDLKNNL